MGDAAKGEVVGICPERRIDKAGYAGMGQRGEGDVMAAETGREEGTKGGRRPRPSDSFPLLLHR
jgi:hypothetical protein